MIIRGFKKKKNTNVPSVDSEREEEVWCSETLTILNLGEDRGFSWKESFGQDVCQYICVHWGYNA